MNGNGTTDLVYANSSLPDGFRILVVDLGQVIDGSANPRLLEKIDNGLGLRTEISYRSSTADACAARENGNPWRLTNPNPVTVVARVETSTGLDLDGIPGLDVSRVDFSYRDGYYDPTRRQFCGFGFVKRIIHGDEPVGGESAKTLVERFAFHTGGPDGFDNDGDGATDETDGWLGREEEPLKGGRLWSETTSLPDDPSQDGAYADDARVFERVVSPLASWEVRRIATATGGSLPQLLGGGYRTRRGDRDIVLLVRHETDRYVIEEGRGPMKQIRATTDVNAIGDALFQWELGEHGAGAPASDDRYTETEYAHNEAAWILGLPTRVRLRSGGPGGGFVSESRNYYDGEAFAGLPPGQVGTRGLLHRAESFISEPADWMPRGEPLPAIEEPSLAVGDPRQLQASVNTARTQFDAFGNPVVTLDANGNRREIAYDERLKSYPTAETVFTGGPGGPLAVTVRQHLGHGTVIESLDFNGNPTTYGYDVFGRLTSVVRPGDSAEQPTTVHRYAAANPRPLPGTRPRPGADSLPASTPIHFDYDAAGSLTLTQGDAVPRASSVRTFARETAGGGTFDTVLYVDGAGKSLAALEESETPGRWVVEGAAWYNLRGAARCGFQPYEQESDGYRTPQEDAAPHADLFHDAAGRNVRALAPPDADGMRHESRTVHRPLQVDAWDAENTRAGGPHFGTYQSTFQDGLGRTVRVIERNARESDPEDDATEYATAYTWTANDHLTAVRDAQDNVKHMRYDGLGRKVFMDDLDVGHRRYTYDSNGNLTETIDAKGQRILYHYDGANRLLSRNFLDATGDPATDPEDEVFAYDLTAEDLDLGDGTRASTRNARGKLVSVRDRAGALHASFDARGRTEWAVRAIPDPATGVPVAYRTGFTYDSLDRLRDLFYPDNDHVAYAYDARAQLESIRGGETGAVVVDRRDYLPSGQVQRTVFGNGAACEYAYDPRQRLTEMVLRGAGRSAGEEVLHYRYRFDGASNVTGIRDLRPAVPPGDPRHNSQRFEYDDLYRLTRYQLTGPTLDAPPLGGEIEFRYDRLGNLLFQSSPATGPGHIEHTEDGRSVVNLGPYTYGGGRRGRRGRGQGETPGPHAVTSTASGRALAHDSNGNAVEADGRVLKWDFRDRLVEVLEPERGSESRYVYDAAGQRVIKEVTRRGRKEWVLYVDRHFEVREGDAPIKYVYLGETRVAQVKGTLDPTRPRIQRLRLVQGWNLAALAVSPAIMTARTIFGLGDDNKVAAVLSFDGQSFTPLAPDDVVTLGEPYWIHALEPRIRPLAGAYAKVDPSTARRLAAGLNVVGWPRLESLDPLQAFRGLEQLWSFDGPAGAWRTKSFTAAGAADDIGAGLPPGAGLWAFVSTEAAVAGTAEFRPGLGADQDMLFYHGDHLGSSNVVTDLSGALVEETAYYPYGATRFQRRTSARPETAYGYTGKERDHESGLYYYDARHYDAGLGCFLSGDPGYAEFDGADLDPREANLYAYSRGNPGTFLDPDGKAARRPGTPPGAKGKKQQGLTWTIPVTIYLIFPPGTEWGNWLTKRDKNGVSLGIHPDRAKRLGESLKQDLYMHLPRVTKFGEGTRIFDIEVKIVDRFPTKGGSRNRSVHVIAAPNQDPDYHGGCSSTSRNHCWLPYEASEEVALRPRDFASVALRGLGLRHLLPYDPAIVPDTDWHSGSSWRSLEKKGIHVRDRLERRHVSKRGDYWKSRERELGERDDTP
jgi:RHS repeat-associated protein